MKVCPNKHRIKDQSAEYCSVCGSRLERYDGPLTVPYAIHSSKEDNRYLANELGLTGEAANRFVYTALEVHLLIEIDAGTGNAKCIGIIDGDPGAPAVKLERPVNI